MEQEIHIPSLGADISDSLHFLLDINFRLQKVVENQMSEQEFAQYIIKRSCEVTYISSPKHTYGVIQQAKTHFKSLTKE